MFQQFSIKFSSFFILIFFISCKYSQPKIPIVLMETNRLEYSESVVVQIDNCNGWFSKSTTYVHPDPGAVVTAENLRPNGGEPFKSLRREVYRLYGFHTLKKTLTVPDGGNKVFNLEVLKVIYTGKVDSPIVDANKILSYADVTYVYPLITNISITKVKDVQCS